MTNTKKYLPGLFAVVCASGSFAMEAPAVDGAGQAIEEITVTGQRTLFELRMQVSDAEDAMYNLFNELNTVDKYDIVCRMDTRVFSHIREKTCLPEYAMDAMMEEAQGLVRGQAGRPVFEVLSIENPRLDARFRDVMEQSPDLFRAVARHYELNESWRLRRKTHFGDDE
jgi:hypothetical protein